MEFKKWKARLEGLDTACLCDVNKNLRVMDPGIRPLNSGLKLIGIAHTAHCRRDFLAVMKALQDARQGEVLVVDAEGARIALAGELFAMEALRKGLAGIIIDGGYRDTKQIQKISLPVYARYITPMAGTASHIFQTQTKIHCGGVLVSPGDILFGDDDGIVVMSEDEMIEILDTASIIQQNEEQVLKNLEAEKSLFDMLNFSEHYEKISKNQESQLAFKI